ncbi:MAG: hypothetical protein JNK65_04190 [Deltaproteobacteria bacterium]|nr:hypothetical protein [Deltaproteobacteria bacterium]
MPQWLDKTFEVLSKAQEEIIKVSQVGKAQVDRSFLIHERNKLFQKMGEVSYALIKENHLQVKGLERFTDQIDRLNRRIHEKSDQMRLLTKFISSKLDIESEIDDQEAPEDEVVYKKLSRKKTSFKKKMNQGT